MANDAPEREAIVSSVAAAQPVSGNTPNATALVDDSTPARAAEPTELMSRSYIVWLMLASFGSSMAMMVPLAYGIALRISELAPGQEEVLGYITGSAQLTYLVLSPIIGLWSDRFRSRLGRRTPFILLGAALGVVGLLIIGLAPNIPLILVGWIIGMFGWSTTGGALQNLQADKLPEAQRGKVSALVGLMSQIAPVLGIGVAYAVSSNTLLVFLVPGLIGAVLLVAFSIFKREGSSENIAIDTSVSVGTIFRSYGFSPRKYPDFAWNWLGRFLFFIGLYFNTTFGTFFYAQRLELPVREVAGIVATIGMLGVVAAAGGALVGGFLSDKLQRRRLFVIIAALLFVGGAVTEAFAYSIGQLIVGAILMQLAIAVFATVNQAMVFAILPNRAEAGRYMAVVAFAQKIPSAFAPLIAPFIILLGAAGDVKNYTVLYLTGGVFALIGGLIILLKVKATR